MYISTRDNYEKVSAAQAIKLGMVPAGGLFVPEQIPTLSLEKIFALKGCSYQAVAEKIISLFLEDFSSEEIKGCVARAYNGENFTHPEIAPLSKLDDRTFILELWHGPTAAFKDMALQIMPHFLSLAVRKVEAHKEIVILVATSGDTGKAALEGFKNVPGIKIIVFYPHQGVSRVQELQMSTTDGSNTYVVAVRGNFDDCQSAVKNIFADEEFKAVLAGHDYELSSANSINWGRLLPQIVYYFYAYLNLLTQGEIKAGEKINFVVPTGNFGNILAGWYAQKMGLPVYKFVCASNENKVLTDFFNTGIYDRNREFKQTNSPSMDILISSNLERFLFELTGHDGKKIKTWMDELNKTGRFQVDADTKKAMDEIMAAGFATERETLDTIKEVFAAAGYTLDTHTAVAVKVYEDYRKESGDMHKTVIDATASPFKFNTSVLEAIKGEQTTDCKDEFEVLQELSKVSGMPLHPALKDLDKKPVLHKRVCDKGEIKEVIGEILGI
ncbi:threonine synthase [Thermanaerosceptrum fracticalcis]|uniref:Threonine synthase n=1 Tax=Thermanaerosceptrum fracticalcis TaxID=1712410 RepID=A0A7G6E7S1_THEFR|nr:threonine synthase [Thermanaerosceptrum fracticalcis]QNB48125.1 threonine synthase [Thermanaerosceptrum fracticalcis]